MRSLFSAVLALSATILIGGCTPHPTEQIAEEPAVSVATPIVRTVVDYEYFTGRTDAEKTVEIRARVSGYLTKILFKPGSEVKEGDSLFIIDPRPYQAELDRADGERIRGEALVARLKKDLERAQKLPVGTITPQELDKINADLAEAEASVLMAAADVESAKLNLEFTDIKAPFGGRIGRNLISEGNLVSAVSPIAEPLTSIVTVDPMFAYFDCDELKVLDIQKRIREGKMKSARAQPGSVQIEIGLANEGTDFPHVGTLDFINNRIDPQTGTLQVRGVFPNPLLEHDTRILSPGLFVRARLPMGEPHEAILINDGATMPDQGEKIVFVVNDENKIEVRKVALGPNQNGLREVLSGIAATDRVVVGNQQRVRGGFTVTPKLVPMPENAKKTPAATAPSGEAANVPAEGGKG
jgi:RND family efflux transporter MFP subunit